MPLFKKKEDAPQPNSSGEKASAAQAKEKRSLADIQIPNWLAVVLLAVIVLIIILVFYLQMRPAASAQTGTSFADEPSPDATQVEVLPQRVRNYGTGSTDNPFASDSIGAVQLTGIITNSAGKATVILQTDSASYIVSEGEKLPQSEWKVSEVGDNKVVLELDGNKKTIWLSTGTDTASSGVTRVQGDSSAAASSGAGSESNAVSGGVD